MITNKQQLRDDIKKRKNLPEPGVSIEETFQRIQIIAETQKSFTPEIVEALLDEIKFKDVRIAELTDALMQMVNAYKRIIHDGYNRIVESGGDCDSPEEMISRDPGINKALKAL